MALSRRRSVMIEREAVYGTDPTPAGTDAQLAHDDLSLEIVHDGQAVKDITPFLDPLPTVAGTVMFKMGLTTPLRGSGALGTAPETDPMWAACGFSLVTVGATSNTYAPASSYNTTPASGYVSATAYIEDGINLWQIQGMYGTFGITLDAGGYAKQKWQFSGLYERPAAKTTFTSPTYDATRPQPCRGLVMTLHGTAASDTVRPISWSMDLNREVIVAKSMQATWGIAAIELGSCVPSGTFRVQYHSIAGKDWFAALEEQTISSMSITYGATAGNIVTISVPGCNGGITVTSLGMSDDNGLITQEIGWSAARNAGDDSLSFVFT